MVEQASAPPPPCSRPQHIKEPRPDARSDFPRRPGRGKLLRALASGLAFASSPRRRISDSVAASAAPRLRRFPAVALPRAAQPFARPDPPRDSPPERAPAIVTPRAGAGHRAVTWVGHSTVLMQLGGLNVLTDPIWSERASPLRWMGPRRLMRPAVAFDALPPIDVVLLSHNHYDHLDAATVRRIALRFPEAAWSPLGLGNLLRTFGVRQAFERDWWQSLDTADFSATCAPAQHFSSRAIGDRGDTLWCGGCWRRTARASILPAIRGFIPTSQRSGPAWVRLIS